MSLDRTFELKGSVLKALGRIARPATPPEISQDLGAHWKAAVVREVLDELTLYGFLAAEDRTEPFSGRVSRPVTRRYYSLAAKEVPS